MKLLKLIGAALFFISVSAVAIAQTTTDEKNKVKKIEVTGTAEMEVVPDELYVNFTLQEYYNKSKEKISIDNIQKDFLDRCAKAGITKDRIFIQNMTGFDQSYWYWRKQKKEQPDLMASTTYIIKFSNAADIDKLVNKLDDNATKNMFISKTTHSKMEEFRKEVKIKALQAAKAKAQYLCESIGEKAGPVIFIHEVDDTGNIAPYMERNMMMTNASMDASSTANEGIDFQKIKIKYHMEAHFAIQ